MEFKKLKLMLALFLVCECDSIVKDDEMTEVARNARSRTSQHCYTEVCGTDSSKWSCSGFCRNHAGRDCDITVYTNNIDGTRETRRCCTCSCFPSTARVSLENKKSVMMSDLLVGDKVQTVSSEGTVRYSAVRAFLRKQHTGTTTYMSIRTSENRTISLTGNHLIYVRKPGTDKFKAIYAGQVAIGDEVLTSGHDALTPAKVSDMFNFTMEGAYVPITLDGNIVVDGVLASCYASSDHDVAHIGMAPIRWFPEILNWIFGGNNGSKGYVNLAKDLGKFLFPKSAVY